MKLIEHPMVSQLVQASRLNPIQQSKWRHSPFGERIVLGNNDVKIEIITEFETAIVSICPIARNEWLPMRRVLLAANHKQPENANNNEIDVALEVLAKNLEMLAAVTKERELWDGLVSGYVCEGFQVGRNDQ